MVDEIIWQTRCVTRRGLLRYMVLKTGDVTPYGAAILSRDRLAVQRCVTSDEAKMRHWCRLLARAGVRPCHLRDVMEDLLSR